MPMGKKRPRLRAKKRDSTAKSAVRDELEQGIRGLRNLLSMQLQVITHLEKVARSLKPAGRGKSRPRFRTEVSRRVHRRDRTKPLERFRASWPCVRPLGRRRHELDPPLARPHN